MNLNPASQLELFGHHFEFCNFTNLYKNKKKYQIIDSNLEIKNNEKLILNTINRLIK